jgi:hypothetical protein
MGFLLKIAIFAVVAYGAWTTVRRWAGILGGGQTKAPPPAARREASAQAPRNPVVEEMRLCPVCAAHVSVAAAKCGRSDCPQPA